jgi:putative membrane protein
MYAAQTLLATTWMHSDVGWGWMVLMMVVMVLFWGAVIFGIFWLIRGAARGDWRHSERATDKESPVDILDRRFAEGEITPEDYQARRNVLLNGPTGSNGAHREEVLTAPAAEERVR